MIRCKQNSCQLVPKTSKKDNFEYGRIINCFCTLGTNYNVASDKNVELRRIGSIVRSIHLKCENPWPLPQELKARRFPHLSGSRAGDTYYSNNHLCCDTLQTNVLNTHPPPPQTPPTQCTCWQPPSP